MSVLGIGPPGPGGTWLVGADTTGRVLGRRLGAAPGGLLTLSRAADARGEVRALAFTPDGAFALTGGADRAVRVWDLRPTAGASRFFRVTEPRAAAISAIAVSADGRWVAIGAADGSIHIWGFGTGGFRGGPAVKTGHQGAITALAFSPDGRWLLSGSADRNARLWPAAGFAETSAEAIVLNGHSGRVVAVGFSPDATLAFTGGTDAELLVWGLADPGAPPLRLRGHDGALTAALVAGGRLLSAGADGQLRRWPFPPQTPDARSADINGRPIDEVVTLACRIAGRNLTTAELGQSFPGEPPRPPTCPAP